MVELLFKKNINFNYRFQEYLLKMGLYNDNSYTHWLEIGLNNFIFLSNRLNHNISIFTEFNKYGKLFGVKYSFGLFDNPEKLRYEK